MKDEHVKKPSDLINGIQEKTEKEAAAITAEAIQDAARRKESAKKRTEAILSQNEKEITQRVSDIHREAERRADMEIRRMALKEQEYLSESVTSETLRRLEKAVDTTSYREILKDWIVEAALGLETKKAAVKTSATEAKHIDESLLRESEDAVYEFSGRRISLTFLKDEPTTGQGIILAEEGENRAFNNQISTRLLRYKTAVQTAIHRELFTEP